jgi:lysosomal acid lipase/cholesteryl ester hydrolase
MVFVALSQGKLLNMLRSAALLSPIAYMNLIPSVEIRLAADKFLADVRQGKSHTFFVNKT